MKNQKNQQHTIEINLREVIWRLLEQWKMVIIASLLIAVLVCGAKFFKDSRSYNAAEEAAKEAAAQAELSADERIESAMSKLPDTDREAVSYILGQKKLAEQERDYLKDSIWLNIDPTSQRRLTLKYYITINDDTDIQAVVDAYGVNLRKKAYIDKIRKTIAPDSKPEYISELISTWSGAIHDGEQKQSLYSVYFVLPEDVDAKTVADIVEGEVKEVSKEINKQIGSHTIELLNIEEERAFASDVIDKRAAVTYTINNLNNSITNSTNALNDDQKLVLDEVTAILDDQRAAEANPDGAAGDGGNEAAIPQPVWNKKYTVFGFVLGLFMYVLFYIVILALKGRVFSASSVESYTGGRLLGEVYYDNNTKLLTKLLHSKFLERYHHQGKADTSVQTDKAADSLAAVCEHRGIKDLTLLDLTGGSASDGKTETMDSVISKAGRDGLRIKVVGVKDDINEREMLDVDNAVLLVEADTKVAAIDRLMALCKDYDIALLGSIYMAAK